MAKHIVKEINGIANFVLQFFSDPHLTGRERMSDSDYCYFLKQDEFFIRKNDQIAAGDEIEFEYDDLTRLSNNHVVMRKSYTFKDHDSFLLKAEAIKVTKAEVQ